MSAAPETAPVPARWGGHAKGTRGYRRLIAALAFAGVATFAQLYSPQALLPRLSWELGIDPARASLTVSLATIGLAVAVLPWSFVADRIGRVGAMRAGILAATVLGLAGPLAPTFETLLALRFLEGVALGSVPAIAIAYLNEEVTRSHAAVAAGTYIAGTTVGGLAGRLVAGPLADLVGWRLAVMAVSVLGAAAAVAFIGLAPKARGFSPAPRGAGGLWAAASTVVRLLGAQLRNGRLLMLYTQAFLLMGSFVAVYNYLGFRLEAAPFSLPASLASLVFLAYLSGTFSSGFAAKLSLRYGRRAVVVASTVAMTAGAVVMVADSLAAILAGLLLFTAGFFAAHGIASGWTGAIAASGRAQAASLYNLGYYGGSSVLGWAGGLVFHAWGWSALVLGIAAIALTTAFASWGVHRAGR
ncbi:MFS transporter [Sinomonas notoginsengisoli]|uniref:MFS transporter n=1 Tax=Sinomonas notoginsengisoli TaxID=1457311 RepID=UPI001F4726DD|nr:MFS transporter [Sinomonas notoginsengisoli]